MTRQIAFRTRGPSRAVLENRIRILEARTALLTEAVRLLAHALDHGPVTGDGASAIAQAAREVRGLLVTTR
jgi:hypothetical protein